MKPRIFLRGGRARPSKPDSIRIVAISTGTGTPYLRDVLCAALCQLPTQPSFWAKTAQTLLIRSGLLAQAESATSSNRGRRLTELDTHIRASVQAPRK